MKNFYVISYILSDYLINDVKVEVYYAPAVVESFYSRKEISELILGERDKTVLDGIFELNRSRTTELQRLAASPTRPSELVTERDKGLEPIKK